MDELIHNITADEDTLIPFMIFGIGGIIAIIAIVFTTIKGVIVNGEREKSRREIAAYIAEGSMSPDDGVRLMNAAREEKSSCS